MGWLDELTDGKFAYLILLTGEGLRRLLGFADRDHRREPVIAALGKTKIITRGPKPVQALKEIGLLPYKIAAAPTTEGVIRTLQHETLQDAHVGVQLYSESNQALTDGLTSRAPPIRASLPISTLRRPTAIE